MDKPIKVGFFSTAFNASKNHCRRAAQRRPLFLALRNEKEFAMMSKFQSGSRFFSGYV